MRTKKELLKQKSDYITKIREGVIEYCMTEERAEAHLSKDIRYGNEISHEIAGCRKGTPQEAFAILRENNYKYGIKRLRKNSNFNNGKIEKLEKFGEFMKKFAF